MATYMAQVSFTADAWANLCKNPQDRSAVVAKQMEANGGKLLGYYFCFGDYDAVVISEAQDDRAMLAAMASVVSAGHVKNTKTTKLFTCQEAMGAMADSANWTFVPPSG